MYCTEIVVLHSNQKCGVRLNSIQLFWMKYIDKLMINLLKYNIPSDKVDVHRQNKNFYKNVIIHYHQQQRVKSNQQNCMQRILMLRMRIVVNLIYYLENQ
jgi:hypothetical protein